MKRTRTLVLAGALVCFVVAVGIVALQQSKAEGAPLFAQSLEDTVFYDDSADSSVAPDLRTVGVGYDPATAMYVFYASFNSVYAGMDPGDWLYFSLDVDKNASTGFGWTGMALGTDYDIVIEGGSSTVTARLWRTPSNNTYADVDLGSLDCLEDPATGDIVVAVPTSSLGSPTSFNFLAFSACAPAYFDGVPDEGFLTYSRSGGSTTSSTTTTTLPPTTTTTTSHSPGSQFPDVLADHPYYAAIMGMAARGIIGGYGNGRFGPQDLVTRQQFAKMIVLTLGLHVQESDFPNEAVPFVDLGPDNLSDVYPHEYVAVCALANITRGVDATHFGPGNTIFRAQVISMVVRAADSLAPEALSSSPAGWTGVLSYGDPTHGANVKKAEYNGLLAGIRGTGSMLAGWNTAGNATRGEVAQILFNLLNKLAVGSNPTTTTTTTAYGTTTTTTAPSGSASHYKWGVSTVVNGLRITVGRPAWDPRWSFYVDGVLDPTRKILMVQVFIENLANNALSYSRSSFTLFDATGGSHSPIEYGSSAEYPQLASGSLLAGGDALGYIAYAVPLASTAGRVQYDAPGFGFAVDAIWEN